jgi:hypothetical protein
MNAAPMTQPRFSAAAVNASNAGRSASNAGAGLSVSRSSSSNSPGTIGGILTGWGGALLVVGVLVILFAVYYKTIGYYINIGWKKLKGSHDRGEVVEVDAPGGLSAQLTPAAAPTQSKGASIGSEISSAISALESDVEAALGGSGSGSGPGKKQVFNISRNLYTFEDAEPVCRAFGAELATYDQVKDAYNAGADWCNYGWTKGQLAVYPTQKSTYEKLQHGPEHERMSCGLPGVNGGYFPNEDQRFGVNCYGYKPKIRKEEEELMKTASPYPESMKDKEFQNRVDLWKNKINEILVSPFNYDIWATR